MRAPSSRPPNRWNACKANLVREVLLRGSPFSLRVSSVAGIAWWCVVAGAGNCINDYPAPAIPQFLTHHPSIIHNTHSPQGNGWAFEDMIRTNQEKFDVTSVFDADMTEYTVPVPECDDETYFFKQKTAYEIEKKATTNVHIAEERGQIVPVDLSEEDR